MAEDISAQARTGVTVMALAALVAVVLNIMVIAQSIVSTGMSTLQSGVNAIKMQEYETFNNKRVTGVQVKTALTLYTTRDNAIVIGTKNALKSNKYYIYGALIEDCTVTGTGEDRVATIAKDVFTQSKHREDGQPYYIFEYKTDAYSSIEHNDNQKKTTLNGDDQFIEESGTFEAQLIKNKTNTIVGIRFTQVQ